MLSFGTGAGTLRGFFWCSRCGAVRVPFEETWRIPIDRTSDVAEEHIVRSGSMMPAEEPPTRPDLPRKK